MATQGAKSSTSAVRSRAAMTREQSEKLRREMKTDPEVERALKAARKAYPELGRKATTGRDVPRRAKG